MDLRTRTPPDWSLIEKVAERAAGMGVREGIAECPEEQIFQGDGRFGKKSFWRLAPEIGA